MKYVKVGTTYIPSEAIEFIDLVNTGTARVEFGLLSGKVFSKNISTTTYNQLKEQMDKAVTFDMNGVGL